MKSFLKHEVVAVGGLLLALFGTACGHDHSHTETASGAVCATGSTLRFDTFAQPFFRTYCLGCHSQAVSGQARQGAPAGTDFDTVEQIRLYLEHIDSAAAAGPSHVNDSMPPGDPLPTADERRRLGEWLACGAP